MEEIEKKKITTENVCESRYNTIKILINKSTNNMYIQIQQK